MSETLRPRILRFEITAQDAGKTIKEYLMRKVGFSSKQLSRFKYRKDGILLNGVKHYVNAVLGENDVLEIRLTQGGEPVEADPRRPGLREGGYQTGGYAAARDGRLQKIWVKPVDWLNSRFPLQILYEDQDILAADKPSGIVCHPSPGHFDDTLSNQVAEHLGRVGQELDVRVTGRLDRDTSGIVVFALNTETAAQLIRQRQEQMSGKLYIARVRGHFSRQAGTVDKPLRRENPDSFRMITADDGKAARTHYRLLGQFSDGTSLIICRIEHGRTHQIRVHMASIGHPLVGDRLYGTEAPADETAFLRNRNPEDRREGKGPGQAADSISERDSGTGHRSYARRESIPLQADTPPLMLHAWRAVMRQPFTGEEIRLEAPLPSWARLLPEDVLKKAALWQNQNQKN